MAATFNPSLNNAISRVRFKIGDTDLERPHLQDETITALLVDRTELGAAREAAWGLVAKYSRLADVTIDDQLTRYSKAHDQFLKLAERLDEELAAENVIPPSVDAASSAYGAVIVTGIGDCRGPLETDCCPPYGSRMC